MGDKMNNYTDLARESISHLKNNVDYSFHEQKFGSVTLEHYEFFSKPKGLYYEMVFENLVESDLSDAFNHVLKPYRRKKRVLFVGLGNIKFNADAIGPLVIQNLDPVENRIFLFIPRVKGQTGMDTATMVKQMVKAYQIDLVVAIDSLCAIDTNSLFQTIQINTIGITPGSALGNNNSSITKDYLKCDVLVIGVPCVIKVSSLINEFFKDIEGFFYESLHDASTILKVGKKEGYNGHLDKKSRTLLLGEIGQLHNSERLHLIHDVIRPINKDLVVTTKEVDKACNDLAITISKCLKKFFYK